MCAVTDCSAPISFSRLGHLLSDLSALLDFACQPFVRRLTAFHDGTAGGVIAPYPRRLTCSQTRGHHQRISQPKNHGHHFAHHVGSAFVEPWSTCFAWREQPPLPGCERIRLGLCADSVFGSAPSVSIRSDRAAAVVDKQACVHVTHTRVRSRLVSSWPERIRSLQTSGICVQLLLIEHLPTLRARQPNKRTSAASQQATDAAQVRSTRQTVVFFSPCVWNHTHALDACDHVRFRRRSLFSQRDRSIWERAGRSSSRSEKETRHRGPPRCCHTPGLKLRWPCLMRSLARSSRSKQAVCNNNNNKESKANEKARAGLASAPQAKLEELACAFVHPLR